MRTQRQQQRWEAEGEPGHPPLQLRKGDAAVCAGGLLRLNLDNALRRVLGRAGCWTRWS